MDEVIYFLTTTTMHYDRIGTLIDVLNIYLWTIENGCSIIPHNVWTTTKLLVGVVDGSSSQQQHDSKRVSVTPAGIRNFYVHTDVYRYNSR